MTLNGVMFSGNGSGFGAGAIGNYNIATVNNVTVADNGTVGAGGGIYNGWKMTLANSLIANNAGGGIFNDATGTMLAAQSAVASTVGFLRQGTLY